MRLWHLLYEALTETTSVQPIMSSYLSRSQTVDFGFLYVTFYFHFIFDLFFYFLFLKQLGLGLIGHAVTSVTI